MQVAEKMIDPYGHDDEDFDLNFLIDRHMKVSELLLLNHIPWSNYLDTIWCKMMMMMNLHQ